jgi:hypothetical protein
MVTKSLGSEGLAPAGSKLVLQDIDRWIFVFMAGLFFITVLIGFIPSSIGKIAAVQAGERAPFLSVLHVHAVLMGTWITLLLTQASLVASKHGAIHKKLGMTSIVLAPAMVVTGILLVPANFGLIWSLDPSQVPINIIEETKAKISNIALIQIRIAVLFPIMVGLAFYFRKSDPDIHKRLMILATVIPMAAAVDRITWLPHTIPGSPISPDLYILLLISPLFVYDLFRQKKVHRAYVYWAAGFIPASIAVHLLWSSTWWMSAAPKLMGVESL